MTTLREVLYETIHRDPVKPMKVIAEELGMAESYLTRAALPDPEEAENGCGCRFPLKKLIPLIQITGNFAVLDHIEHSLGRVAIKLPQGEQGMKQVVRLTMTTVKEFGELIAQLDAGMADGSLSDHEISRIEKEGYDAVQAITILMQVIKGMK